MCYLTKLQKCNIIHFLCVIVLHPTNILFAVYLSQTQFNWMSPSRHINRSLLRAIYKVFLPYPATICWRQKFVNTGHFNHEPQSLQLDQSCNPIINVYRAVLPVKQLLTTLMSGSYKCLDILRLHKCDRNWGDKLLISKKYFSLYYTRITQESVSYPESKCFIWNKLLFWE